MTATIERPIRLLFEICAVCGDELVGDNTMSGKPWDHLAGPPADGHLPVFGQRVGDELARKVCAKPDTSEEDAALLEARRMPPPEQRARPAAEGEIGDGRSGRRQILNLAKRQGFVCRVEFARGPVADQWGRFSRMADSLAIAGYHPEDERAFVAFWVEKSDGSLEFQGSYCHGVIGKQGSDKLKIYLKR